MLTHNTSARIIRSNQSLVLQRVTRESSGNYSCSAINAEGETVSNQFVLKVKCKMLISLSNKPFLIYIIIYCFQYHHSSFAIHYVTPENAMSSFLDIPFCKTDSIIVVGALHGERIRVGCTVEAYPPPRYEILHPLVLLVSTRCKVPLFGGKQS